MSTLTVPLFSGQNPTAILPYFHVIHTNYFAISVIILQLLLGVSLFVRFGNRSPNWHFPVVPHGESHDSAGKFAITAHSCVFLGLSGIFFVMSWMHHHHRMKGYLQFYRKTAIFRRVPFLTSAAVNAVIVIIYETSTSLGAVEIIIFCETVLIVACMLAYIAAVTNHNLAAQAPDAQAQMTPALAPRPNTNASTSRLEDLDLIRFLRERNDYLNDRLRRYEGSDSLPQIRDEEAQHLLEAREKDIKLLRMERNELQERLATYERRDRQTNEKEGGELQGAREQVRRLQLQVNELEVSLQVERETNAKSQRIISQLKRESS